MSIWLICFNKRYTNMKFSCLCISWYITKFQDTLLSKGRYDKCLYFTSVYPNYGFKASSDISNIFTPLYIMFKCICA